VVTLVLVLLKFVEDSPIRSWKAVVLTAIPLAGVICYYASCAFPPPPPPTPEKKKINNYRAEMERTMRHAPGVRSARIDGSQIYMDFATELPIAQLRSLGLEYGTTAAYFMSPHGSNLTVTIHLSVINRERLEIHYSSAKGTISERTFD
jgi:hypothetical protein